jgi:glycosyltransferase involved in cell wall biosynthesis
MLFCLCRVFPSSIPEWPRLTDKPPTLPTLSVIIPASNEADLIGQCLNAVLASQPVGAVAEIIVVVNGSTDETAEIARGFAGQAAALGWQLDVLDITKGGKMNALNQGDRTAKGDLRVYLDADVVVSPELLSQIVNKLSCDAPAYSSGKVCIPPAKTLISRAYGRIYRQIPFMETGVPGCGLFAVNKNGRGSIRNSVYEAQPMQV